MDKTKLHLQTEMETSLANAPTSEKSKSATLLLLDLEVFQNYISALVTLRISCTSHDLVPLEERHAVIEDVSQNSLLKLWSAANLSETKIDSPAAYTARIVRSESIDEIRRRKRKPTVPLPLDQNGEILQSKALLTVSQGTRDPAIEYEFKEFFTEVIDAVVQLPSKQRYIMICVLKEEVGSIFPLAEMFMKYGIDIAHINRPEDPNELQRFHSLLSVARRTLREKFCRSIMHKGSSYNACREKKG
jgi:hypothetical protein